MRSVFVLGNLTDDEQRQRVRDVVAAARRYDVEAVAIEATTPTAVAAELTDAVAEGCERLLAVGGDGVAHLAVNAVAGTDTILGLIPDGTGNDFARALGLLDGDDTDLDGRVRRALSTPSPVDAVRTDHGWVASVATLGFSGDVTARANALRWPTGSHRYTVATLLQLPRLRTLDVVVTVDGERLGDDTTLLAIGNTAYFGGGMKVCPTARPDDGLFHAISIGAVSRRRFLRVFPTVFSGRHVDRPEVSTATGTVAIVDGPGDITLWADGERLGPLPVRLDLVPAAVRVAGR